MNPEPRPPKHLERAFVNRRTYARQDEVPLSRDDIRREMGWTMLEAERKFGERVKAP